jgi:hypothetical protein
MRKGEVWREEIYYKYYDWIEEDTFQFHTRKESW